MTVDINNLKDRSRNGKVAFGSIITDILDRSLENPDSAIQDVYLDKEGNIVLKKDNGDYETVEISATTYDDKIDESKVLSDKIDISQDGNNNHLQFYKFNGEKDVSLDIPINATQSGINKALVLSYFKKTYEDNDKIIYTAYNYNDLKSGEIVVYKNPKITHITNDKVISAIEEDTTNESKNKKYNVNDYNGQTKATLISNYIPQGDAGNYKKVNDLLGKDVSISGLTSSGFSPRNMYIPEVFEYGDESNTKEYIAYYIPQNYENNMSSNLLLQIQSSSDNNIKIFDIISSFNASEVTDIKLSSFSMTYTAGDKKEVHFFAIRPNEINIEAGGFFDFDFILSNEWGDVAKNGQTFALGKVDYGEYLRSDVDKKAFNFFNLFDLNYEPYSSRSIKLGTKFFGSKVVPGYSEDGTMAPYLIKVWITYTKDVIDPKKDKIKLTLESYGLFINKNGFDNFIVKEQGISIPMSRAIV